MAYSGSGRILRLVVLGVRAQRPRRYYLTFQVLANGTSAAAISAAAGAAADSDGQAAHQQLQHDVALCRTETAALGRCPEFTNRAFVLRLPSSLDGSCSSSNGDSSSSSQGPRLLVNLFAAPSTEEPAGEIVAGKEVDPLIAAGSFELAAADVAARLAVGERVVVPLQLAEPAAGKQQLLPGGLGGQAAQLQSLRSSLAAGAAGNLYGSSDTQVLLELMLLDAGLPAGGSSSSQLYSAGMTHASCFNSEQLLLQDSSSIMQTGMGGAAGDLQGALGSSGAAAAGRGEQAITAAAAATAAACSVTLSVLVSAAVNLPLVPGADGRLVPPSAFVALKSAADAAAHRQPQAITRAAPAGQNPVWSQLLQLSYPEQALPHEQLQVSVLHEGSGLLLLKGSVPLSCLIPGQHYSLAVALSDACCLYLTLVLGLGAKTQLEALQGCGMGGGAAAAANMKLLQLRLASCSPPLQSLWPGPAAAGEVWAVWRSCPCPQTTSSSSSSPASLGAQQLQLHSPLDGREGSERAAAAVLRSINSSSGLLSTAVLATGRASQADSEEARAAVLAALPLQGLLQQQLAGAGDGQQLWPQEHLVLLPCWAANPTAVTLELYMQPYPGSSISSSSRALQPAVCFAKMELPLSRLAQQQSGRACMIRALQLTAALPGAAKQSKGGSASCSAAVEVVQWEVDAYLGHLRQLAAAAQAAAKAAAAQAAAAAASTALSLPGSWPEQQQSPHATASPAPLRTQQQQQQCSSLRCASQDVLETLVGDALAKQQTLERLQRSLDVAESRREVAACRLADVQAQNSKLSADLQHLRQLLHEEREAAAAALGGAGSSAAQPALANANREQLLHQLDVAAAAHARERTRNAELVHRLQQLHAEQVDVIELQKQYAELQEAHYQQSQLLCDQEASTAAIAALRKALSDQEAVISRLEALLAAAAGRAKEGEGWRSTADALQAEMMRLREELARLQAVHPADEIAEAAARAAAAAAEQQAAAAALAERDHAALANAAEFEARLSSKESERLAAAMRAERAEAAATAAQNELLDVTKRYAREIAQLKTKLAEKDAQLLGGFGSLANLCLSELGPGSSLQLNPAGFQNPAAAGLGFGQYAAGAPLEGLWGFNNLGYNQGLQLQQGLGGGLSNGFDATAGGAAAAAAAGGAAFGVPRVPNAGTAAAAAAAAGRAGSPKLQPLPSSAAAAASSPAAAATTAAARAGSPQQQSNAQIAPYLMRAGTAERALGLSKPGSPLAPLALPRVSTSAEGQRSGSWNLNMQNNGSSSPGGAASPAAAAAAASPGRLLSQQMRPSREYQAAVSSSMKAATAAAAAGGMSGRAATWEAAEAAAAAANSPGRPVGAKQLSMQQRQQQQLQQQQAGRQQMLATADEDDEYEGSEDADDGGLQHLSLQELQQMQQQLQSPAAQQRRQLIPSSSRASQQQQQQQQPCVQSPAGQLGPARSGAGSGAGSGAPPPPAKTGLHKWFG
uniref:C2 domain-containing protein n=1 Tax=Tetradesmus obliquus TaxID=3088 RepID=A0A383WD17_TETOB|eukprot:jgi/Sobl393_1/5950/SZX75515.1